MGATISNQANAADLLGGRLQPGSSAAIAAAAMMCGSPAQDTLGRAVDALNSAIALVNAASQRVKTFGVSPQISVNGPDYGDTVSLYLQGEPAEPENL